MINTKMENIISEEYFQLKSSKNMFKRLKDHCDHKSPKFFSRKQSSQNNVSVKSGKKHQNQSQMICYISPSKLFNNQSISCKTLKQISSDKALNVKFEDALKKNISEKETPKQNPKSQIINSNQQLINSITEAKKLLEQQNKGLKITCSNLEKEKQQQIETNTRLREQNLYLYSKIQDFTEIVQNKNKLITELEFQISDKDQLIEDFIRNAKKYQQKINNLQSILESLHKTTFDTSFQSILQNCSEETSDEHQEQELQYYKLRVIQLTSTLKYSQINQSMLPKLKSQLKQQKERNKKLKNSNHQLKLEIHSLQKRMQSKNLFSIRNRNKRNNLEYEQISLQLSPEK